MVCDSFRHSGRVEALDIRISSVRSGSFSFLFLFTLFSNESDETGCGQSSINNKQPKPMVDEGIGFEEVCPRTSYSAQHCGFF